MRIVVSDYVQDEQRSLDCHFCEEEDQPDVLTTLSFYDNDSGNVLNVCPEHLDQMVVVALERHKAAMENKDPFWYLSADPDPWAEEA